MRLVAALVIALLPAAALAQSATTGSDPGTSGTGSYGGGSAYGSGSPSGSSIDTPVRPDPRDKPASRSNLGGNYGYEDKLKPRPAQ
jgi:hypothetical protein